MRTFPCILLAMLITASASAQPVYETRDKAGPVFSDLPSEGASEVSLPPLNLSDSPPAATAEPAQAASPQPYQSLEISVPAAGGTVHSNTGQIPLQVTIDPALRTAQGDAIVVTLDGTALAKMHSTVQFEISSAEWQVAAKDDVEHQLQVSVVDRSGKVLLTSATLNFYVHRATENHHAR